MAFEDRNISDGDMRGMMKNIRDKTPMDRPMPGAEPEMGSGGMAIERAKENFIMDLLEKIRKEAGQERWGEQTNQMPENPYERDKIEPIVRPGDPKTTPLDQGGM